MKSKIKFSYWESSQKKENQMIDELTPDQEKQLAVFCEKGIETGLSTKPVNKTEAKKFGKKLCDFLKRPYRATIIVNGPYHAFLSTVSFAQIASDVKLKPRSKNQDLKEDVKKLVQQVEKQLAEQNVFDDCDLEKLFQNTIATIKSKKTSYVYPYLEGQVFSYYVYFYKYFRDVLGIKYEADFELLEDSVNFGLIYPLENGIVIISERWKTIERKGTQLHCETGPAWEYKDGSKGWSLNGIVVPQWLVETPAEKLDPKQFSEIENVEVRKEFIRKMGVEILVHKLGAKEIDKQGDYSLLEVDLGKQVGNWRYLKMMNPSIGAWHMECVGRDCNTVQEAINFRASMLKSLKNDWKPEELT